MQRLYFPCFFSITFGVSEYEISFTFRQTISEARNPTLIPNKKRKTFRLEYFVSLRTKRTSSISDFVRSGCTLRTGFVVICPITSTIKDLPTRYSLPNELDINGQVIISQLKSLDFNSRNLVLADCLPLQDMAKINQIIDYVF